MKKHWKLIVCLIALSVSGYLIALTSSTNVGRMGLEHPDLGHDGGSGLHTKVRNQWTVIADHADSRFFVGSSIADSTTTAFVHGFGADFVEYRVMIYTGTHPSLTRVDDFVGAGWVVAATSGSLTISIDVTTPGSGGPHDFAVVLIHGRSAEKLDDLDDVNLTTTPESLDALIFDGTNWIPGASGDVSFRIQSVATDGTTVLKGGGINWSTIGEAVTYDGAGTLSTDFFGDITIDLDNLIGGPVNDTTYWLYIDNTLLAGLTTTDTDVEYQSVTESELAILSTDPFDVASPASRYAHIGFVRYATAQWSTTIFGTSARREHQPGISDVVVPEDGNCGSGNVCSNPGSEVGAAACAGGNCTTCSVDTSSIKWAKVGMNVIFGFRVNITATVANILVECDVDPFISETFSDPDQVTGTCSTTSGANGNDSSGVVSAETGGNKIRVRIQDPASTVSEFYRCIGIYDGD